MITALILYNFGTGPIRGFATTLSIGIISSVFSALVITRLLVHIQLEKGVESFSMARLVANTNFQFMSKARFAIPASIVAIIIGLGVFSSLDDKDKQELERVQQSGEAKKEERRAALSNLLATEKYAVHGALMDLLKTVKPDVRYSLWASFSGTYTSLSVKTL